MEEELAKRNKEAIKVEKEGKEEEKVMARSLVLELESGNRDRSLGKSVVLPGHHVGPRKEETVDTYEEASTQRGIAEALGWDSMVLLLCVEGQTGADCSSGGTNFGGLEG